MIRRIGVNVVTLLPFSLGKFGLGRASLLAYEAGFDGLQIMPLRDWGHITFSGISAKRIISFELAWNCGSLFGAVLRHLHLAGENKPRLRDWLLFEKCDIASYRTDLIFQHYRKTSLFVSHDVAHVGVMEMNPENKLAPAIYANYARGICWDTEHIIRPGRHGEPPVTDNWRNLLDKVGRNIRLIHVKSSADPEMLRALAKAAPGCPVILEDPPIIRFRGKTLEWLKGRREFLGKYFE